LSIPFTFVLIKIRLSKLLLAIQKNSFFRQASSQFVDVIHHSRVASRNQPLVAIPDEERAISAMPAQSTGLPVFGRNQSIQPRGRCRKFVL
jgi:hypothetical protein